MKQEAKPLDTDKLIAPLQEAYGINISNIEFLPLGYDLNAAVYRGLGSSDFSADRTRFDVHDGR
jgi:hypothetical protein